MRRILVLLVATLAITACKKQGPTIYRGIPAGTRVTCRSLNQSVTVYACVGSGKAYTCIEAEPEHDDQDRIRSVLECARVSTTITPEEPKNDE